MCFEISVFLEATKKKKKKLADFGQQPTIGLWRLVFAGSAQNQIALALRHHLAENVAEVVADLDGKKGGEGGGWRLVATITILWLTILKVRSMASSF